MKKTQNIAFKLALICVILVASTLAQAAEHFGVKVYQGAQFDEKETTAAREAVPVEVFCYRTKDSVEKVAAFYQNHPGLVSLGADETGAMFIKEEGGSTVRVMIASPWTDVKTGNSHSDTLIQILKAQE